MSKPLTYASYLQIPELLTLQSPKSDGPEHDEMLFIIIHQVYELWFKELLHELDYVHRLLVQNDPSRALHTFRRMLTILKTVVSQIDILETMTPVEFNSFRGFLESASGFQSAQFREMEFALGLKRRNFVQHFEGDPAVQARLLERFERPSLWDAFMTYLHLNGYAVPEEILNRDVTEVIAPSAAVQEILIDIYYNNPVISRICERLVDFDEGFQEWRYRHVKMVERTIGMKSGTGGSAGANYLKTTLNVLYPDLWAIRSQL